MSYGKGGIQPESEAGGQEWDSCMLGMWEGCHLPRPRVKKRLVKGTLSWSPALGVEAEWHLVRTSPPYRSQRRLITKLLRVWLLFDHLGRFNFQNLLSWRWQLFLKVAKSHRLRHWPNGGSRFIPLP